MKFSNQEQTIIDQALSILEAKTLTGAFITSPAQANDLLRLQLATKEFEVFAVVFLSSQHQVIEVNEMFNGTIDSASVYPREVAKRALEVNAAAVILSHNHPSDSVKPSQADIALTSRIQEGLELFDIKVLDHIIVTRTGSCSFAERGLL